jgi:hypothetical protein
MNSQNNLGKSDDQGRIVLNTFIPDNILVNNPSARKLFITKLGQITSLNGMGGSESNFGNRFIISGDLNVLTKDILPGAPTKYLVTIECILAVGDGIDGKSFASDYIEFKGSGVSEDKAFIDAIRKINPRHKVIQEILILGKEKIIEYYNAQCDFILKEAQTLSDSRNFDEAIYSLNQIPEITKECYDKSMDLSLEIALKKFEFDCQSNIAKAKVLISNGDFSNASQMLTMYTKDIECYSEVEELLKQINTGLCSKYLGEAKAYWANRNSSLAANSLSQINASSPCYNESLSLSSEISGYLDEKEQREWDLNIQKYKDEIDIENRRLDSKAAMIQASRDIGVAYGKNQPRSNNYNPIIR